MSTNDPAIDEALNRIKHDESEARGRRLRNYTHRQESLIDDDRIPHSLNELHGRYLQADALANYFQHKTMGTLLRLFVLVFVSTISFEGYAHFVHEKTFAQPVAGVVANGIEWVGGVADGRPLSNVTVTPDVMAGITLFIYVAAWVAILFWHRRAQQASAPPRATRSVPDRKEARGFRPAYSPPPVSG